MHLLGLSFQRMIDSKAVPRHLFLIVNFASLIWSRNFLWFHFNILGDYLCNTIYFSLVIIDLSFSRPYMDVLCRLRKMIKVTFNLVVLLIRRNNCCCFRCVILTQRISNHIRTFLLSRQNLQRFLFRYLLWRLLRGFLALLRWVYTSFRKHW